MNYLVTGAAGFIGAALAKKLVDEGHHVVTIDNLSTGFEKNIPNGVEFIKGDTFSHEIIDCLNKYRFDAIFHLAGQSGGVISWENPVYDMNSNITATLMLLQYAYRTSCRVFVYASSMSVYGDENPCPVREDDLIKPKSFYAVGKMASENYMRVFSEEYGIKCTALRLNNVYGPGQNMENLKQGMVSIFLAQAIKNRHIDVFGDRKRYRDFVYIDDVVDAFVLAGEGKENELYNTYNVATSKKTTCEELISLMCSYLDFDVSVKYEGRTLGDQFGIYCSYEKINNVLGFTPKVSLENGLRRMIEWAIKNND